MSVLFVQPARVDDPDLHTFDSGVEEVNRYFSEGRWFDRSKGMPTLPTYRFAQASGDCVGFASGALRTVEFPESSGLRGKYLVIYAVGVNKRFIGEKVSGYGTSYAFHIFEFLQEKAKEKQGCIGMSLWVRADNPRAIRFYEKFGFAGDPGGPVHRDQMAPHLTMVKRFR